MLTIRDAIVRAMRTPRSRPARLALFLLPALAAFAFSIAYWRSAWLGGPAPSYVVLANLTRSGECGMQLFDNEWYGSRVLAQTNGAVFDVFTPSLPTLPVLIAPLAFAPAAWLPALWAAGNIAALALATVALLTLVKRDRDRAAVPVFLVVTLFSAPLREDLARGQLYLAILLLHVVVLWSLLRRRSAPAGIALALLFALKITGWPYWPLLGLLRR
jgi:hypothetical protein